MPAKSVCGTHDMLLLDIGNSRIKWALVEDGEPLRQGASGISEWRELRQAFASLPPPHKILASNVAGDEAAQQLRSACASWDCPVEFITAQTEQCGVRNAYDQPAQLGSDRWAALIAAWHHERAACLVVSCGTATTIDALSGAGEFLGGLILPGVDMMRRSLATGAAQLEAAGGSWREFPRNTADAMASGVIRATVGAIVQQYDLLGTPGARCLLGGGAADSVQLYLNIELAQRDLAPLAHSREITNDLPASGLSRMASSSIRAGEITSHLPACGLSGMASRFIRETGMPVGLPLLRVDNLVLQGLQIIGQEKLT